MDMMIWSEHIVEYANSVLYYEMEEKPISGNNEGVLHGWSKEEKAEAFQKIARSAITRISAGYQNPIWRFCCSHSIWSTV